VGATGAKEPAEPGVVHHPPATGAPPWRAAIAPFVVSRLVSAALITAAARARSAPVPFGGFAKWDGGWYTLIATRGYFHGFLNGAESPWPFFPLLPALIRALHWIGPSPALAGVLIDHVAFFVGLAGLYRITSRHFPARTATLAVWAIALFPASFVFSMVYPSAILFAASVWAFDLAESRHDLMAGLVVAAAVMVRPNGLLCAVALAVAVRWSVRRILLVAGPSALAFAGWCWFNHHRTGDWLHFLHAKRGWTEIDLVRFVLSDRKIAIPHVLLALAAAAAVVVVWRRLPQAWVLLSALYLALPLATGMVGLGRYAGELFPPFAAAGEILRRWPRWALVGFFVACVAAQAVCVYWVVYLDYIP